MYQIAITNQHPSHIVDQVRMRRAVRSILYDELTKEVTLSVAIVDDATIRRLNCEFLRHDVPTDVLSFVLDATLYDLDAEVVASADTAAGAAKRFGWTTDDELLLYVIHGTLHLMGYNDRTADDRAVMRARERYFLAQFGLTPRFSAENRRGGKSRRASNRRARSSL